MPHYKFTSVIRWIDFGPVKKWIYILELKKYDIHPFRSYMWFLKNLLSVELDGLVKI